MPVFRRIFICLLFFKFDILCLVEMAVVEEKKFESEVKCQDIAIKAEQTDDVTL